MADERSKSLLSSANFSKFESETVQLEGRSTEAMGTKEYLLDRAERQGIEKGAEVKSYEFVKNLIQNTAFDDAKIASLAVVRESFVKKVRADLKKKK
ncbi:hypothetical protein [Parapedobacter pyrenivorans]|uniref:hypothetical protein n=1 Tax=Parapedobacter pyrenivorans TaxID=1305674 RepID=UPI00333F856C